MRDEFERLYYKCKPAQVQKEKEFLEKYKPKEKTENDKSESGR